MNKISKQEEEKLNTLRGNVIAAKAEYDVLLSGLNNQIQALVEEFNSSNKVALTEIRTKYIDAAKELKQFSLEAISKMEAYSLNRSDKWHDGEAGFRYRQWIEEWEDLVSDMDDADEVEFTVSVNLNWVPEPIELSVKP